MSGPASSYRAPSDARRRAHRRAAPRARTRPRPRPRWAETGCVRSPRSASPAAATSARAGAGTGPRASTRPTARSRCGCSEDSITARSATALARISRARLRVEAPSAEKNTNRSTPARSAARTRRHVATPASSSIEPVGWSRITEARWTTVSTPRSAWRNERWSDEVSERDLHPDPLDAESPGVAHEAAHRHSGCGQPSQQRHPDRPRGSREQQHREEATAGARRRARVDAGGSAGRRCERRVRRMRGVPVRTGTPTC